MSGASKVVDLWGDQNAGVGQTDDSASYSATTANEIGARPSHAEVWEEIDEAPNKRWTRLLPVALSALALAWIVAAAFAMVPALRLTVGTPRAAALDTIVHAASIIAAPLVVLGLFWLIARRQSGEASHNLKATIMRLGAEREALTALLANAEHRLSASMQAISAQGERLDAVGAATINKIATLRAMIDEEIGQIGVQTNSLKNAAAAARSDMAVLLANLPKAHIETRKMSEALSSAGASAQEHAQSLLAQLTAVELQGLKAKEVALTATSTLAAQIGTMTEHCTSTQQLVADSHSQLAAVSGEHIEALHHRTTKINDLIAVVGIELARHDGLSEKLFDRLRDSLADVEGRLAAIDTHGADRTERLTDAIKALAAHSQNLRADLAAGGERTRGLIADAEALMVALDASARELDETLPAALERVARVTAVTHGRIAEAADHADAISAKIGANKTALAETDKIIESHHAKLAAAHAHINESSSSAQGFVDTIAQAEAAAASLTEGASVKLIEALLRVRETAQLASERAKETLSKVIPDAVAEFGSASEAAFRDALQTRVAEHVSHVSTVAEQAVASADQATSRLMQQMLTITETSQSFAQQLDLADQAAEARTQTSLARRVSLLIESLNSISIDVTKILSNDVTDTAWSSYLKGDRGIFTRRAVRLIDAASARDIIRHYDEDTEFREHVNHYIHDFEAMLRTVLGSRESGPLSVALLSSDMGKIYVALAHAIERLRT